jgi:RND family efflux transporter MFP subunit
VTVARPVQHEVIEWDEYTGNLAAIEAVEVRARVSGLITSAPFDEGAIIKQGDLLFEIDSRPYEAELEVRKADAARAAAQLELARIESKRIESLPEDAAAPFERMTVAAHLHQAQAELEGAQAQVKSAELNVEWCRVIAPIGGRISRKVITTGNLVTGGGGQSTLLTTIASIDPIYSYFEADERSVLKYTKLAREGKRTSARDARIPCLMRLSNEEGFPHEGVIDFVDNRVDPATGTMLARGVFDNTDGYLVPGFFTVLRVPGSGQYETLLVPDAALVIDQNRKTLLVVGTDDTVQVRPVTTGALFGNLRAIAEGIEPGDRVIVEGMMRAQRGAKVAPHETVISTDSLLKTADFPSTQPESTAASVAPTTGGAAP